MHSAVEACALPNPPPLSSSTPDNIKVLPAHTEYDIQNLLHSTKYRQIIIATTKTVVSDAWSAACNYKTLNCYPTLLRDNNERARGIWESDGGDALPRIEHIVATTVAILFHTVLIAITSRIAKSHLHQCICVICSHHLRCDPSFNTPR